MRKVHVAAGFSLIELMVAVAMVGILAAIAVPSYTNFIRRGEADAAWSDLQALSLGVEGRFRRVLAYPATPAVNNKASIVLSVSPSWGPSSKPTVFDFQYTLVDQAAGIYQVSAVGQPGGKFANCSLILRVTRGAAERFCSDPAVCQLTCTALPAL
jgi:type IV pilus assembly protein PilE